MTDALAASESLTPSMPLDPVLHPGEHYGGARVEGSRDEGRVKNEKPRSSDYGLRAKCQHSPPPGVSAFASPPDEGYDAEKRTFGQEEPMAKND